MYYYIMLLLRASVLSCVNLLHQFINVLLKIIYSLPHLIQSTNDLVRHLLKLLLLVGERVRVCE